MVALPKTYLRPISSAVVSQSQSLAAQNSTPVAFLPQVRSFQTSPVTRDIDSAAKFIGAGAATVGVAGSGKKRSRQCKPTRSHTHTKLGAHATAALYGLAEILHLGHTYEYLVTHFMSPREGLRFGGALRCLEAYSTSQPDAACQLHGRGDQKCMFRFLRDIDISRHQQFEYDVQAGYNIQNSIQTNLLQAHFLASRRCAHVRRMMNELFVCVLWGALLAKKCVV